MGGNKSTQDVDYFHRTHGATMLPGVVLVFSDGTPRCGAMPLVDGRLVVGRGVPEELALEDLAMSRRHASIAFDGERFDVEDLGSRNGLVLDGVHVAPRARASRPARPTPIARLGRSVLLLVEDVRPYLGRPLSVEDGQVIGPVLRQAWDEVDRVAESGDVLHLQAESGAGKELAARRFHARGPRQGGPFIAVNCAAVPASVAERLLFGTRKGAFSGATENAEGYFQAAHGGTLFLDEVAELDLDVQAKLLRVLETREVLPLGAARAVPVDVRVVSATHHDARQRVTERRFREDLYFRLCRPAVRLPPLRERPEELAFLARRAIDEVDPALTMTAAFVEACLLRPWPGNVRELLQEIEDAADRAARRGAGTLEADALDDEAGRMPVAPDESEALARRDRGPKVLPDDEVIEAALAECEGRVATAARKLGVHRNQLRRWLSDRGRAPG